MIRSAAVADAQSAAAGAPQLSPATLDNMAHSGAGAANHSNAVFERLEFDVTDYTCQAIMLVSSFGFSLCGPGAHGTKKIVLDAEEAEFSVDCGICNTRKRLPYGELGSVDQVNCLCCVGFGGNFGAIFPGSACDSNQVQEIVGELKARMKVRGDTGQIQRTEQILLEVQELKGLLISLHERLDKVIPQTMTR